METSRFTEALPKSNELEITFKGRKTGRSYTTPVWFVHEGSRIYLLPVQGSATNWYKNVQRDPGIRLSIMGKSIQASVKLLTEPKPVEEVVDKFKTKYGAGEIMKWYKGFDVAVEVKMQLKKTQ